MSETKQEDIEEPIEPEEETPDEEIPAAGQVGESDKGEELPVDEEE